MKTRRWDRRCPECGREMEETQNLVRDHRGEVYEVYECRDCDITMSELDAEKEDR